MCIEACRFTFACAKTHRSIKAPTPQHTRGGQCLGKATPIPRHPQPKNTHGPADVFCQARFLGRHRDRTLSSGRSQPRGNTPERQESHGKARRSQSYQRFREKPFTCAG
jgi:hypothetical protein